MSPSGTPCYALHMRITVKPPSPPKPPLPDGTLITLRVEAADPAPRIDGPVSIAYEGRFSPTPAPGAFLFPAAGAGGVSTRTSAHNSFRLPLATEATSYVDIPAHEGDTITATLLAGGKAYTAALTAPAPHNTTPVELQLAEGPQGPTPPPAPSPGLTITPDPDDPDVLTLDPAPGNDNIVVVN